MDHTTCPHLGALDEKFDRGPHIGYPSFENRCMAMADGAHGGSSLMLTDQATYCLSGSYSSCPRFQALQNAPTPPTQRAIGDDEFLDLTYAAGLGEQPPAIEPLLSSLDSNSPQPPAYYPALDASSSNPVQ